MDKTIDYILEVAKCGGITKAAQNLYITPSALSKFVQSKEDELNVKLFSRVGKKFILTYAGERYVELLQEMFELKSRMDNEMNRIASAYMGRLRIGFQMSLAETVITKVIPDLQEQYPNIQIMLEENHSMELINMMRSNQLDIAIALLDSPIEEYRCDEIADGEVIIAVPNEHQITRQAVKRDGFLYPWIDVASCSKEPLVLLSSAQVFRKFSDQLLLDFENKPRTKVFVRTTKTALLCVTRNMGITVNVDLLVRQHHLEEQITMLSFGEHSFHNKLCVISARNSMLADEISAVTAICKEYFN